MKARKPWLKSLTYTSIIFGLMIGVLLKVYSENKETTPMRHEELVATLIQVERAAEETRREIGDLTKRLKEQESTSSTIVSLEKELKEMKLRAGYLPVKGPGIKVTLNDSKVERGEDVDPNNYFIHESFLREIVNSMLTGGAEAIAINNQRLVGTSEIFCGGTTIFINDELVVPPYEIVGLGEISVLKASLEMDVLPMLTSLERQYGIGVEVEESREFVLPAYAGGLPLDHLRR